MTNDVETRRARAGTEMILRILATGAVWTVALALGYVLRHPIIRLTAAGVAVALTILIWTHNPKTR